MLMALHQISQSSDDTSGRCLIMAALAGMLYNTHNSLKEPPVAHSLLQQ